MKFNKHIIDEANDAKKMKDLKFALQDSLNYLGYADQLYKNISFENVLETQVAIEKILKKMK